MNVSVNGWLSLNVALWWTGPHLLIAGICSRAHFAGLERNRQQIMYDFLLLYSLTTPWKHSLCKYPLTLNQFVVQEGEYLGYRMAQMGVSC